MPRPIHRLTARTVAALNAPGRYADGGNLYLRISPSGAKKWGFLYSFGQKKNREIGLGHAGPGGVSLAEAREKAAELRRVLADGRDPKAERDQRKAAGKAAATTFGEFADEYIRTHESGWSNPKHRAQWWMTLSDAYCQPIRGRPVGEIGVEDVLAVLSPVWQTRPETARRLRMRIERILDAAKVRGLREGENPARWRGGLDHLLPHHPAGSKRRFAAMPYRDVPGFFQGLTARRGTAALALRFLIATAARTGEVLAARWDEIDEDDAIWTVPAERMKARRPHRVPLSDAALSALNDARGLNPDIIFPGPSMRRPISNMTMAAILKRDKLPFTVHGFRSSFRDWAAEETPHPSEVAEMALAHAIGNATEAAYRRGDLFAKRRTLMADWGHFLTQSAGNNVVALRSGK